MIHQELAPAGASSVRVSDRLLGADIQALANGDIIALRVPEYCAADRRARLVRKVCASSSIEHYKRATGVARIGKALVETKESEDEAATYFGTALRHIHELRQLCSPELTPFDQFRLELDEQWPGGAHVAPFAKGKAFCGLLRIFQEGGAARPHQDMLRRDTPHEPIAHELVEQIAMNIYLQTAESGGELELWNLRPSPQEYMAMRDPSSHGIDREKLAPSSALIKPHDGDLILFRSTNLHAVRKVEGRQRITWTSFVGVRGPSRSLVLWS